METGGFTSRFSRPGNGYDVLGLQSDTVEVLDTNSSALRSFQVPNFFGYQKKLEGLVGCCFFFVWERLPEGVIFGGWFLLFVLLVVWLLLLLLLFLVRGS